MILKMKQQRKDGSMTEQNDELKKRLGGEYKLTDGRVFWMDSLAVDEIMKRLEMFEFRLKEKVDE